MFKTDLITKLNTRKNLIIAILSLIAFIGLGVYFTYNYDVSKIQEATMKYWEDTANKRAGYVIPFAIKNNAKRQVIITKYGLTKIVSTVIFIDEQLSDGTQNIEWNTFYIHRIGLFQYNLDDFNVAGSAEYKFDQAVELAKKYDINKENPDKTKINNYPNLDPTSLQKILSEQAKEKETDDKTEAFNKLPKEERVKICQDNLTKMKAEYESALKERTNGSTKFTDSDFEQTKIVIDFIKCEGW